MLADIGFIALFFAFLAALFFHDYDESEESGRTVKAEIPEYSSRDQLPGERTPRVAMQVREGGRNPFGQKPLKNENRLSMTP